MVPTVLVVEAEEVLVVGLLVQVVVPSGMAVTAAVVLMLVLSNRINIA